MISKPRVKLLLVLVALGCGRMPTSAASDPGADLLRKAVQLEASAFDMHSEEQRMSIVAAYEQAANAGNARAQGILSSIYDMGEYGVVPDVGIAQSKAEEAMQTGDLLAAVEVANCDNCREELRTRARSLLEVGVDTLKAQANAWDARAAFALVKMHLGSVGVAGTPAETLKWAKLAAKTLPIGASLYAHCLERGVGQEPDLTKAIKQYERSARGGIPQSAMRLARAFAEGVGVEKSLEESRRWTMVAAGLNYPEGQALAGYMYMHGIGGEKNAIEAFMWYSLAGEENEPTACFNLGVMYENGEANLSQDYSKAAHWYFKAAEQEHAKAQCNLGWQYEMGKGVPRSTELALKWYRKAAKNGDATAQCNLALLLIKVGTELDFPEIKNALASSAAQGDARAIDVINAMVAYSRLPSEADLRYQAEVETEAWAADREYRLREDRYIRGY